MVVVMGKKTVLTKACVTLLSLMLTGWAMAGDGYGDYRDQFEPLPALPPIPADNSLTPEKIELGKMLFFEPRIS